MAKAGGRTRVVFTSLAARDVAAFRAWCERPLPYLEKHGIDPVVLQPAPARVAAFFFAPRRANRLGLAFYTYAIVLPRRLAQLPRILSADAVFIQRGLLHYKSAPLLEGLVWLIVTKLRRRPILYHLDDALWAVARPRWYQLRCRFATTVVTGNEQIAAFARAAGGHVEIVEYAVDETRYTPKEHHTDFPVTIGFTGLGADGLLARILEPLREVCATGNAKLKVVSSSRFEPPELQGSVEWEPWTLEREFTLFDDFDIGLMPIEDNEYNRGKESYKLKEYMAAGIPIVASPVGYNVQVVKDGVNGFVAHSEEEWAQQLKRLVEDHELRARLGANGRKILEERYTERAHAEKLLGVIRRAVTRARDSGGE